MIMDIKKVLEDHKLWLDDTCGNRADLTGAYLTGADLSGADLSGADLRDSNLTGADLSGADLSGADLSGADLTGADLRNSNLSCANLRNSDLSGAKYDDKTAFFAMQCPEEGSFVAWKKCINNVIVKLLIPEDAERSSATTRKCRASKVIVLDVFGAETGISGRGLEYRKGETVYPDNWDNDRWNDCSHGIHFFITRREAELYG